MTYTATGSSVTAKARVATDLNDQSCAIGNFNDWPPALFDIYQQFALSLSTLDVTQSPTVTAIDVALKYVPQIIID
jgi:hypothetical protein